MAAKQTTRKKPQSSARKLHSSVRAHYYRHMPNKKHHRVMVWVVFLFVVVVIAAQMLYPPDRAVPLAHAGSKSIGMMRDDELAKYLEDSFLKTTLKITVGKADTMEAKLGAMGAELQTQSMIDNLTDYPFWQRFIPLSILWQLPNEDHARVHFTATVLEQFANTASKKLTVAPKDARLMIKNSQLVAVDDTPGFTVKKEELKTAIKKVSPALGKATTVDLHLKPTSAKTTSADFAAVKSHAEAALARPLTLVVKSETFTPSKSDKASWLTIGASDNGPVLKLDDKKVASYLKSLDKKVGTPAGQTNINLKDGREVSRKTGSMGKAIDITPLIPQIHDWILDGKGDGQLTGQLVDVAPSVIYNHKYTSSEAGLRAYVHDAARDQNANIVVQQLDGNKWSASDSANLSIPSASTYKLYVAKILFDKMDRGETSWDDPILDTNVDTCFDRMTIASTNPCPREWLRLWGRDYTNKYIWNLGFSHGTTFTAPDAVHTTAADLAKMMIGIEDGSLIGGAHRDRLLHSLSVHPYRYGVPTGSSGQVWDKVGFLWDYVHDAAIVHHPKGKYVIVVMTKGRSYATIANITREVERIMYP